MEQLAIFLYRGLLYSLVTQVVAIISFLLYSLGKKQSLLPDYQLPKAAVIICLRGADPFLSNCLRSLLYQNYPHYDLKIVIDSQQDPAWKVVTDIIAKEGTNKIQVSPLRVPRLNCSLKCSSLVQAVSDLDNSYKVVALIDTNAVVHPNWLRELVSPLSDPKVGATTGNSWYLPTGRHWGSLVRYLWNVSAVVQMYLYKTPWGGTLALKTEVIHQTGLLDKWKQSYADDTMIQKVLAKHRMRVKFVPTLLILNRQECNLSSLHAAFGRQLFSSRLYNPFWLLIVAEAISSVIFPNLLLILFFVALLIGDWQTAAVSFIGYGTYVAALILFTLVLQKGVAQLISPHGEAISEFSLAIILKMLIAIPLTQWVYGVAMVSSLWISTITWRGVTYRVKNPWNIKLVEYRPYQSLDQSVDHTISL